MTTMAKSYYSVRRHSDLLVEVTDPSTGVPEGEELRMHKRKDEKYGLTASLSFWNERVVMTIRLLGRTRSCAWTFQEFPLSVATQDDVKRMIKTWTRFKSEYNQEFHEFDLVQKVVLVDAIVQFVRGDHRYSRRLRTILESQGADMWLRFSLQETEPSGGRRTKLGGKVTLLISGPARPGGVAIVDRIIRFFDSHERALEVLSEAKGD